MLRESSPLAMGPGQPLYKSRLDGDSCLCNTDTDGTCLCRSIQKFEDDQNFIVPEFGCVGHVNLGMRAITLLGNGQLYA